MAPVRLSSFLSGVVATLALTAAASERSGAREAENAFPRLASRAPCPLPCPDSSVQRIIISLRDRMLWVVDTAQDTLLAAPAAVGSSRTLRTAEHTWTFVTPRGVTRVAEKQVAPPWVPPDWHYVEVAKQQGLRVERLTAAAPVRLSGGRTLLVRRDSVGLLGTDSVFQPLPPGEEIIFNGVVFIPPFGTVNRLVPGVLGPYRLLLQNGVGLHGTPYQESIGLAVTHGCIRLRDADITWLYERIPVGTTVVIY